MTQPPIPSPPPPARDWVKLVLAFGIAVSIGLAPFLGTVRVPGFRALLTLFPSLPWDTTTAVIPISAFVMGLVAVTVQDRLTRTRQRPRAPKWVLILLIIGLVTLVVTHTMFVRYIDVPAIRQQVSVLVGLQRSPACVECAASLSDAECLRVVSLNPARIESCWGDVGIRMAFLAIFLPYLLVTSLFGVLIGYLPIRRAAR